MRLRPVARLALLLGPLALWGAGCQNDVQCVHSQDCPATYYCVADSSGIGHCDSQSYVFGVTNPDAGTDGPGETADGGLDGGD